jgi:hypothetical protein
MARVSKMKFLIFLILIAFLTSCKNDCNCSDDWDVSIRYFPDDLVFYNDTCWISIGTGRIRPGPWLQNGNDIWIQCED